VLKREPLRNLRHCFKFLIRLRSDQMLKALDQLRFSQSKAVQCLYKRHQDNFVRTAKFANQACTKRAASGVPDAADANAFVNELEREIYASADHAEVVVRPIHKIPAEVTD